MYWDSLSFLVSHVILVHKLMEYRHDKNAVYDTIFHKSNTRVIATGSWQLHALPSNGIFYIQLKAHTTFL